MNRTAIIVAAAAASLSILAVTAIWRPRPLLVWNASASVPEGLYAVRSAGPLRLDELVVVSPPEPLAAYLDRRRYLPAGLPLLKHVAALSGQTVCRQGFAVSIDGVVQAYALARDHAQRDLPSWSGCLVVRKSDVFLLNRHQWASLDGRYFGVLPTSAIVGRAAPIWADQAP